MSHGPDAPRPRAGARRPVPGRRWLVAGVAAAGVVLLLAAGVVWWRERPAPNVGTATVRELAAGPASASAGPTGPAPAAVPTQAATLPGAGPVVRPTRLSIPAIGVTATVVPTGVDARGEFSVPPSIDAVGWYRYGPGLDATAGSVVIAGHVDSATAGPGAFFRLRELSPGERFTVTGDDGRTRTYRVVAREQYPKATIDLRPYFATTGAPRLALFTCGGGFDPAKRSYEDNIVVTAVPA